MLSSKVLALASLNEIQLNSSAPLSDVPNLKQKLMKADKKCEPYLNELALVKVPYFGFDNKTHEGVLLVHQSLASEILEIFQLLHQNHFAIETIHPFGNGNNVTISYNCREVTYQPGRLSQHSFGRAIDINPLVNPYIKGEIFIPPEGKAYRDREKSYQGQITRNSLAYQLFVERGWDWGGNWVDVADLQHFEKRANGEKRNPFGYPNSN
ncbi:MAG: M15 family metallopeptidase [Proteobacteria bacterium]|nr:M15 family metallopeptidase [Pseudomonadota bacterium]